MDTILTNELINLAVELTKLAVKGTATAVAKKVTSIKDERSVENVRNVYDEIVNELLQERDEAIRIAQSYKSELDRVIISDADIEHLHNTISRVLGILKNMSKGQANDENISGKLDIGDQLIELINKDTIKTMQLLGFNYKAAIGEPLTNLCANKNYATIRI